MHLSLPIWNVDLVVSWYLLHQVRCEVFSALFLYFFSTVSYFLYWFSHFFYLFITDIYWRHQVRCERETYETPGSDWVSCPVSQSIRFFLHLFLFFFATVSYFLALIFSLFDRVSLTFITFPYMTQSSLFFVIACFTFQSIPTNPIGFLENEGLLRGGEQ